MAKNDYLNIFDKYSIASQEPVQVSELDPSTFYEEAPIARPDVPDIEQQLPKEATDGSIVSGFFSVMDNIVPDDMGGLIRGSSGWLSELPGYEETVGRVAGAPLSAAETVINVVNWGSEQMNHLGAALFSALPGGIQTLDWEQSQDISMGQVVTANAAINSNSGFAGGILNVLTMPGLQFAIEAGKKNDPQNVLYSKDFDILDEEQRKEAFEDGGVGQWTSGFADAIWLVAADPTIIGGKATNIIRLGTKVGEFGGLSNQALRTANQVERFGTTLDEQAKLIDDLGIEGARQDRRFTAEGENLIAAMENDADGLVNHVWVKNANDKRAARALLGATEASDPITAAALAGALAGNKASWQSLRTRSVELYEAAADTLGVDLWSPVGANADDLVTAGVKLTDDQIRLGDDYIDEILATAKVINRGGSRVGPRTVRAANAWREGASRGQYNKSPLTKTSRVSDGGKGHFVYDTIEGVAGSRPVQIIRWFGKGTPNGIIGVKGGPDGESSLDEFSAWLAKAPISQENSSVYINRFAAARTVNDRKAILMEAEAETVNAIAAKNGISSEMAREMYDKYNARRAAAMETIAKSETKFYVEDGKLIKVPDFYAELDQTLPLLDVKMFSRVARENNWLRYGEDVSLGADYLNSLWKVSVLLRLGYTQRNLAEGALRSFAVLGLIAANPRAWLDLPSNARYYAKARRGMKGLRLQEKRLAGAYENLRNAEKVIEDATGARNLDEIEALYAKSYDLKEEIRRLSALKKKSKKQQDEIKKLEKQRKDLEKKADKIRTSFFSDNIVADRNKRDLILTEINGISDQVLEAQKYVNDMMGKRKIGGFSINEIDGISSGYGAFTGAEGRLAYLNASADRTTYMTFDSAVGRRIDQLGRSSDFKKMDPKKLSGKQMQTYWDEYALRINRRYREDTLGKMILENRPYDEIKSWLIGREGTLYRKQMDQKGRRVLDLEQNIDEYLNHLISRLDNELPNTELRNLALQGEVTGSMVAASLSGRDLPVLVGRIADDMESGLLATTSRGINRFTDGAMRALGTIPENKMLRHPFYRTVFDAEQRNLWRMARDQGVDVTSPTVQKSIAKSAHRQALKATRETMYTIDRLSNAAQMLRFISPFFPAWENSIRTWGRIAWTNPAVVGYGNLLWNIPADLGLVVDENGEQVTQSNMLRDEGNFIKWPQPVQDFLKKELGLPIFGTPGQELMFRQQGLNTILPGAEWWFSGLGPAAQIPTAWFLRGKPEDAEVLKNAVGEEMYRQIVPGGNTNVDLFEALLPTTAKRFKQMLGGETTDSAYIRTWNQIIEDEYIKAQLENRTITDADIKRIEQKANRFWQWQIGAAAYLPFQQTIRSEFQIERDAWNRLIDDESIPYVEKIKIFLEQYPGFEAITRSTSVSETGLSPNLKTWQRITKNKDMVDKLYDIDPELVGMFGNMGKFDDPFSYAVYGEFGSMEIGPKGLPVRRRMTPTELIRNNEVKDGWTAYWEFKDYLEDKVLKAGYSSLQVKEAKPLLDELDNFEIALADRYPAWGEERNVYTSKLSAFLQGAKMIVSNPEMMDEDSTVAALSEYMQVRDYISKKLDETTDNDAREQLRQIGYKAAFDLRQKDIGFADFYDQYLSGDDFREVL